MARIVHSSANKYLILSTNYIIIALLAKRVFKMRNNPFIQKSSWA